MCQRPVRESMVSPPVAGVKAVRTNPAVQAVAGGWNGRRDGTKRSADNGYAAYPLIMTQNRYLFTLEEARAADGRKRRLRCRPLFEMQMARGGQFRDWCWEKRVQGRIIRVEPRTSAS